MSSSSSQPAGEIKTLRMKPFTTTLAVVQKDVGTVSPITIMKELVDETGENVADIQFVSRVAAEYCLDYYCDKDLYKFDWAPKNVTDSKPSAAKLEYRLSKRDEMIPDRRERR
ncbi:hypothetical protein EJB05_19674 [Eragrostis curvula]|uniref:Uncharacterized protein n=1 Tax=Eragrostis curvula TaxID=38414 RepID=A0A5J9UX25_9POAL|nr:hypothetical protein EJB05_19674 [Eragrostis curvula]